jgi:hypothetical protein
VTRVNVELENFLDVLRKRLSGAEATEGALRQTLEAADVLDLARETAELDEALDWLVGTLREIARFSPSAAFALAGRFAAQRGLGSLNAAGGSAEDVTSGVVNGSAQSPWTVTVPTLFEPRSLVLLDRSTGRAVHASWDSLQLEDLGGARRSGLRDAQLQTVRAVETGDLLPEAVAQRIAGDWDLFSAAVAVGVAERALIVAETYAGERRQFGSTIATFAGLRAILAEMQLLVSGIRALLEGAVDGDIPAVEVLAVAGRSAVDVCLNAIQVLGGYGYIDEFPVAGLLRDAVSIRARGGGRRSLVADVAVGRLGRNAVAT